MRILALDLSVSCTGWAIFEEGMDQPLCGTWKLADGIKYADRAFVRLSKNVMDLHRLGTLTHVAFEEPIPPGKLRSGNTTVETLETQVGLASQIMRFGAARGVNWSKAPIDKWRSHFLGFHRIPKNEKDMRGNAPRPTTLKAAAINRCRDLGWAPGKHDAAEALGILDYTMWRLGIERPWAPERRPQASQAALL